MELTWRAVRSFLAQQYNYRLQKLVWYAFLRTMTGPVPGSREAGIQQPIKIPDSAGRTGTIDCLDDDYNKSQKPAVENRSVQSGKPASGQRSSSCNPVRFSREKCLGPEDSLSVSSEAGSPSLNLNNVNEDRIEKKSIGRDQQRLELDCEDLLLCSQKDLKGACKRRLLSMCGRKELLVSRLRISGVENAGEVIRLSSEYEQHGAESAQLSGRAKAKNWTKNEAARLCHVMADPRSAVAVARLYDGARTRSDLDRGIFDPWSSFFCLLFNDTSFNPQLLNLHDGVNLDIILELDPCKNIENCTGAFLKAKWSVLRSDYKKAHSKYSRSGQGESDTFPSFSNGDLVESYMHCVFYGLPALDMVLRELLVKAQAESGLREIRAARLLTPRKQRDSSAMQIREGLGEVAASLAAPVIINVSESATVPGSKNKAYTPSETAVAEGHVAHAVQNLIDLEARLEKRVEEANERGDGAQKDIFNKRLQCVRSRIDELLS